jgi:hypothetical protein
MYQGIFCGNNEVFTVNGMALSLCFTVCEAANILSSNNVFIIEIQSCYGRWLQFSGQL